MRQTLRNNGFSGHESSLDRFHILIDVNIHVFSPQMMSDQDYLDAFSIQDYEMQENTTTAYECFPNGTVLWPGLEENSTENTYNASTVSNEVERHLYNTNNL